jgi:hypothetical protein
MLTRSAVRVFVRLSVARQEAMAAAEAALRALAAREEALVRELDLCRAVRRRCTQPPPPASLQLFLHVRGVRHSFFGVCDSAECVSAAAWA